MTLSTADLEQLLSLALAALRANATPGVAVQAAAVVAVENLVPVSPQGTLADWLVTYQQILGERDYKPQTIKNRTANIKRVRTLWGARPIREIKPHEIATPLKKLTASNAARVLAELRDIYTEAIANGLAETNPASHLKSPRHHIQRVRLTFETWRAMLTLAQAGPQRWVPAMLLLALVTGQRRGDLARMRFDDIVTDEAGVQYLRIEQQKKAGKPIGARVEIPLALRLDVICMTLGEVITICRESAKPGLNLLRKAGGGPIEESSLSARFHEHIVAVLGDEAHKQYEWPSLHEVRSLSARLYDAQGVDVQTLLGHKHAEMTEVYKDDRGLSAGLWKRVAVAA